MRKIIYMSLILLTLVGCNQNIKSEENKDNSKRIEEIEITKEENKEEYIDDNPIKVAFYNGNKGVYKRLDNFQSKPESMKEIGIFSIILSSDEEVRGPSIKGLFKEKISDNPEYKNYKIGFNIKFTLSDGRIINENILKPIYYENYGFAPYIYAWIYDDVNANGWHSHIEEEEFNDDTIMSSIKLMWGLKYNEINSDIELTVFTYGMDDFDESGNYRGISKFTTIIERS